MYPMSNEVLDRMVKFSEIPKPLLDKLAMKFPSEDKDLFYENINKCMNLEWKLLKI